MIESNLQKQLQKHFQIWGVIRRAFLMKIIQAQMGFAPKHIGFLGLAGIKIEEKSMKNR